MNKIYMILSLCAIICLPGSGRCGLSAIVTDISPNQSTLDPADPDGASGGRVNGIGVDSASPGTLYAASEWGGLFKSTDTGQNWFHLNGHVPTVTWDVEVDPSNSNRVYATSFYDGRISSQAGISVSTDGGATWIHPAAATPPAGFCTTASRRDEPSAFGISIDPGNASNVYVGTNCGLAISNDSGVNWTFVDPTPADGADNIWDVVVHDGGIIDLCGDDGHQRSTDGGNTWTTAATQPLPGGRCSLAVSPDESYVLFAVVGTTIFESDDGGQSWPTTYANPTPQGRIPFVATNQRAGATYDLWFGDVSLFRGTCTTPAVPAPGGSQRCNASAAWAGGFTRSTGGHDDCGDIAFDPQVATDACPILFSSDGGVYRNTLGVSPGCHSPQWEQPTVTPHALWHFDFEGVSRPGAASEDLYFGNQDTGSFGSSSGGAASPSWINERCCDGFDVAGDSNRVLSTICCFSPPPATRLFISNPGMAGGSAQINTPPPGNLRSFQQLDSIVNFGPDDYAIVTSQGIFITGDVSAAPVVWTELGSTSTPANACGIQAIVIGGVPTFFIKSGGCNGILPGNIFRYEGIAPGGTWQPINGPGPGGLGVYDVDPNNANRIIASYLPFGSDPQMVLTLDGGTTWSSLRALDDLMIGGGVFSYNNQRGPTRFTGFNGYPQPTLVAFDPNDPDIVVAGGADSGVFLSTNGGTRWELLTDPFDPGTSGIPHIPRPRYAHFDYDAPGDDIFLYIGTQGRGSWRITFQKVLMPEIQVPTHLDFGDVCVGDSDVGALEVCNTSEGILTVSAVTSSNPELAVIPPSAGFPVNISGDFCFPFQVEIAPSAPGFRSSDLSVTSNDPNFPTVQITANGMGTIPEIKVTGSTDFGVTSAWRPAEKTISVCNIGKCDLTFSAASIGCPDFTLVSDPTPATVLPGACLDVVVAFTPTLPGLRSCELTLTSNDPINPMVTRTLMARTPPTFSLHAGLVDPHGALGSIAKDGSAINLDFIYPIDPNWAWDVRLGFAKFDGRSGNPDTDLWTLGGDLKYTINPSQALRLFLNGGGNLYHFDPGDFEAGVNFGLGLNLPLSQRFGLEATYNYHWAFTASPDLKYSQYQLGLLISF
ncbi:MAG: choice-of-anchor D domain-containing protein [Desulfobacterales bacterium]